MRKTTCSSGDKHGTKCKAASTLRRRSLTKEHYFSGKAFRPNQSVTKTELFENRAFQTGGFENAGVLFSCGRNSLKKELFDKEVVTIIM